jgi:predicted RecB family nuclease
MPVTIDITQDLRYRQGVETGIRKAKEKMAVIMLQEGLEPSVINQYLELGMKSLEELASQTKQENSTSTQPSA